LHGSMTNKQEGNMSSSIVHKRREAGHGYLLI